ncbi:Hypothetical predicted protein [Lecanosticta acicola]|uniref:DUF7728 domain-containing protein n=1 Tax=Lecanosticta acicola TaxID=111012 RepID=A0AAI8YY53_9PEZI|nr:Hypothetical predicted protein [Lecanosticta acicola]
MLGRTAGVFTACALGASAFLLPPNVASADGDDDSVGPLALSGVHTKSLAFQLPCSECAFSFNKDEKIEGIDNDAEGYLFIQGGANSVVVNFTVSEDGDKLEVNGGTIYPFGLMDIMQSPKVYISQVPASASMEEIEAGTVKTTQLEVTGHGVSIRDEQVVSPEGDVLVPITVDIFEIEGQPVSLDEISVQLVKTGMGELLIAHGEIHEQDRPRPEFFGPGPEDMPEDFFPPPPPPPGHEMPDTDMARPSFGKPEFAHGKDCGVLPAPICRLKSLVESKIDSMRHGMHGMRKGCHGGKGGRPHMGKLPGHIKPHFLKDRPDDERPHHHGRPHHMRPHGHHGHHRHHFMHAFTRGLAAVLLPTMAGIAVGMTVSLVGLLVGRLIGFFWIKFYRGGRRGYARVALDETTADAVDDEKEVVESAKDLEAPPVYEEAPAYEEAVGQEK